MSNQREYLSGTNPRSSESVFAVASVEPGNGSVIVTFFAEPNRTYTVQYRDGLSAPAVWRKLADVPARPSARTEMVIDGIPAIDLRLYRVVTPGQ